MVLLLSVFCNATFWNGYVNHKLALLLFAAWLLLHPVRRAEAAPILGFGPLIFLAHAAVFAVFALLVGVRGLLRRRLRAAVLGLGPVVALGAWFAFAGTGEPAEPAASAPSWPTRPIRSTGAAVNLIYTAGLGAALGIGLWQGVRRRALSASLVLSGLLLLAGFLVLPRMAQNVVNPGERPLIPGMLVPPLAVPLVAAAGGTGRAGLGGEPDRPGPAGRQPGRAGAYPQP